MTADGVSLQLWTGRWAEIASGIGDIDVTITNAALLRAAVGSERIYVRTVAPGGNGDGVATLTTSYFEAVVDCTTP